MSLDNTSRQVMDEVLARIDEVYPDGPVTRSMSPKGAFITTLRAKHLGDRRYLSLSDETGLTGWLNVAESVQHSRLSQNVIDALGTAMLVEDHLPGYGEAYNAIFPVQGVEDPDVLRLNRSLRSYTAQWIEQEDGHAVMTFLYLLLSSRVDPLVMEAERTREGAKVYVPPGLEPASLFAYTIPQEASTRTFYSLLKKAAADEPVLVSLLSFLAKQEAVHCSIFCDLLEEAIRGADQKAYDQISASIEHFEMPLSRMIDNYKERAINMMRTATGYRYNSGFGDLERLLKRVKDSRTGAVDHPIEQLLALVRSKLPRQKRATPLTASST